MKKQSFGHYYYPTKLLQIWKEYFLLLHYSPTLLHDRISRKMKQKMFLLKIILDREVTHYIFSYNQIDHHAR